jgi:hypothetical protein
MIDEHGITRQVDLEAALGRPGFEKLDFFDGHNGSLLLYRKFALA